MKRGRPLTYTPAIGQEILTRMRSGEVLMAICAEPHMPPISTVSTWKDMGIPGFSEEYAGARVAQGAALAEKAYLTAINLKGDANAKRVAFDAGRWLAGKVNHEYGDKPGDVIVNNAWMLEGRAEPASAVEWQQRAHLAIAKPAGNAD